MKQSYGLNALRTSVRLTLAAIAVSTFSLSATANEQLKTMTVTANRMPSVNVLVPTTVITREDIERLQINDLSTLLSRQVGIDLAVNGGIGKSSSIFIRGTNSDHVLVLIDGVKWHSATLGTASFQHFPVEQIERVEIVRGPRSGLYGAEAIGGVIQIFTRRGQQGVNPYAKISYGTHDAKQATVGLSGGNEQTTYSLNFNHQSTEGIDARVTNAPDDDGYRNNSVSANLQHQINDNLNVGLNFLRAEASNQFDAFSGDDRVSDETVQQVIGTEIAWQISDRWLASFAFSESRDQADNFNNSAADGTFNTRHRFFNITNTFDLAPNHTLNLGLDYENDYVDGSTDYQETSRDNRAVFMSWQSNVNKHSWFISGRHDNNEAFGSHNTGTAEWGYWLQDNLQFSLNYGTAFKEPTFNDLYFPDVGFFIGNSQLQPEKSNSFAMNINGYQSWGNWGINIYNTHIRDLIVYQFPQNENVDRASISGIEFEAETQIAGLDIAFNATILDPTDNVTGNILPRRAKRLANLHMDKQWGAWSVGASWKVSSYRYDNAANTTRLSGYGIVDVRAAYQLDQDWSIQASVSNLFDKEYQTINNYNSLDTIGMVSLSYTP